jgi:hypothetical protein
MKNEGHIYSTIVKLSHFTQNSLNAPIEARRLLGEGQIIFLAGPDKTPVFTGSLKKGYRGFNRPISCLSLYNETHPLLPELPLQIGDKVTFEILDKKIRILSITKNAWSPAVGKKRRYEPKDQPTSKDSPPPPKLPPDPELTDLVKALAQWIQNDPFQRTYRSGNKIQPRGTAPRGKGWDFRLNEFAYTRSWVPAFPRVHETTAPVRERMHKLREKYDWEQIREKDQISKQDIEQLEADARWIFDWSESVYRKSAESSTWAVFASAVAGAPLPEAPVTPPMSRVASFASEGLPMELPAWDSRISTSVIHRIDRILETNDMSPDDFPCLIHLRLLQASGGTRPRPMAFRWRIGFPTANDSAWEHYLAIADFLRQLLGALNDPANGIPRMPLLDGGTGDWDMFNLNLVLFMDGF